MHFMPTRLLNDDLFFPNVTLLVLILCFENLVPKL